MVFSQKEYPATGFIGDEARYEFRADVLQGPATYYVSSVCSSKS